MPHLGNTRRTNWEGTFETYIAEVKELAGVADESQPLTRIRRMGTGTVTPQIKQRLGIWKFAGELAERCLQWTDAGNEFQLHGMEGYAHEVM